MYRVIRGEAAPSSLRTSLAPRSCCEEHGVEKKFHDLFDASVDKEAFFADAELVLTKLRTVGYVIGCYKLHKTFGSWLGNLSYTCAAKGGTENRLCEFLLSLSCDMGFFTITDSVGHAHIRPNVKCVIMRHLPPKVHCPIVEWVTNGNLSDFGN